MMPMPTPMQALLLLLLLLPLPSPSPSTPLYMFVCVGVGAVQPPASYFDPVYQINPRDAAALTWLRCSRRRPRLCLCGLRNGRPARLDGRGRHSPARFRSLRPHAFAAAAAACVRKRISERGGASEGRGGLEMLCMA